MRLYNKNSGKIEELYIITAEQERPGQTDIIRDRSLGDIEKIKVDLVTFYVDRLSENQLNDFGYYLVEQENNSADKFYKTEIKENLVENKYKITYEKIERPLEEVIETLLGEIKVSFERIKNKRPRVDTGLGYDVDGSREDKDNFRELYSSMGETDITVLKDADNNFHQVTKEEVLQIANKIALNGQRIYALKWEKEEELKLKTFQECLSFSTSLE